MNTPYQTGPGNTTIEQDLSSALDHIRKLEAADHDFNTRVQTELARLAAATGTQTPANVSGASGNVTTVTRAELDKMTPTAAAAHFSSGGKVTN